MSKKYKKDLIYSVAIEGDGSAYPHLMETMELAEWDQANMYEGWGEECIGTFTVESDSPISIVSNVSTPERVFLNMDVCSYTDKQKKDFLDKFFPEGFPLLRVEISDEDKYYDVYRSDNNKFVQKTFAYPSRSEENRKAYEIKINGLSKLLKNL
jgi:hypothetical protein